MSQKQTLPDLVSEILSSGVEVLSKIYNNPSEELPEALRNPHLCDFIERCQEEKLCEKVGYPVMNSENFLFDGTVVSVSNIRSPVILSEQVGELTLIGSDEFTNSVIVNTLAETIIMESSRRAVLPVRCLSVAMCRFPNINPNIPRVTTTVTQQLEYIPLGSLRDAWSREELRQYQEVATVPLRPDTMTDSLDRSNVEILRPTYVQEVIWSPEFILEVCRQVLGTLAILGEYAFFHSDLRVENILIGEDLTFRITNFGTSNITISNTSFYRRTYFSDTYRQMIGEAILTTSGGRLLKSGIPGDRYLRLVDSGMLGFELPGFDTYIFIVSLFLMPQAFPLLNRSREIRKIWDTLFDKESMVVYGELERAVGRNKPNDLQTIIPILSGKIIRPEATRRVLQLIE